MNNNPLAAALRKAYIQNVLCKPAAANSAATANTLDNILKYKRICLFEQAINLFLTRSGQRPVSGSSRYADEKNLLIFSLQLSGYIRDAQKALDKLTTAQACDPDLINLYKAAAKYSADCSGHIPDSKYFFQEHCDYRFWKVNNHANLAQAEFSDQGFTINPERHNLFLSMPFHIKSTQEELQTWSSKYLNRVLDNPDIFGSKVDVYLTHFPLEQPRGEKFALSLETIRHPQNYFEPVDMNFVKQHWLGFLGQDLKLDKQNRLVGGTPFTAEEFAQKCQNITVLGYCAGVAHAHRWINAFASLAGQVYDQPTVKRAMQNIYVISYAFLPVQKENLYSGAHFMSNYANDNLRKEPFIKMFNPELYEQSKYLSSAQAPALITTMPDGRNHIIALNLPENFAVLDANNQKQPLPNLENGHHMGVITGHNANALLDYPLQQFRTVLENASLGYRGKAVFNRRENLHSPARLQTSSFAVLSQYRQSSSHR